MRLRLLLDRTAGDVVVEVAECIYDDSGNCFWFFLQVLMGLIQIKRGFIDD